MYFATMTTTTTRLPKFLQQPSSPSPLHLPLARPPSLAPFIALMAMLVDYAASDDDDDDPALLPSPSSPVTPSTTAIVAPSPSVLPSAAQLFDSPTPSASTSDSSSVPRKRPQVNRSSHPSHAHKVPRAGPNSSSVRTPSSASLVPPQLRGRSNVATEDLDKLFVNRHQRKPD